MHVRLFFYEKIIIVVSFFSVNIHKNTFPLEFSNGCFIKLLCVVLIKC